MPRRRLPASGGQLAICLRSVWRDWGLRFSSLPNGPSTAIYRAPVGPPGDRREQPGPRLPSRRFGSGVGLLNGDPRSRHGYNQLDADSSVGTVSQCLASGSSDKDDGCGMRNGWCGQCPGGGRQAGVFEGHSTCLSFSIWNMGSSVSLPPVGKDNVRQQVTPHDPQQGGSPESWTEPSRGVGPEAQDTVGGEP